jgi:hypothetical protein
MSTVIDRILGREPAPSKAVGGEVGMAGRLGLQVIRRRAWLPEELEARVAAYRPQSDLGRVLKLALRELSDPEMVADLLDGISRTLVIESRLAAVHLRWDVTTQRFVRDDYGVVSRKVITTVGAGYIVDAFQNLVELETMIYHGIGTGTNAEALGDTALQTELTTQYNPNSTRATGTPSEPSATVFRTIGTNAVDASVSITEHSPFNQAATGGGVCFDRSVFSAIALVTGDSLQTTYDLLCSPGG